VILEWQREYAIGVPVEDTEHRYLCELINDLHDAYLKGALAGRLTEVFEHLAAYVNRHFKNEEALMKAVGYPGLAAHRKEHEALLETTVELTEGFVEGSAKITEDTMAFLKRWLLDHIAVSDQKIGDYILKTGVVGEVELAPAFAEADASVLKKCTMCGKTWTTFAELAADDTKKLKGVQLDSTNHLYNLILFNCACGTTLALLLKDFIGKAGIPFELDEIDPGASPPAYCLQPGEQRGCLDHCACAYTSKIIEAVT